ncbi:putative ATP-dependent helicase IRC3, partial [Teratosphaeriaceae sp. CCFEE 6253]
MRRREIAKASTFEQAVSAADTFAKETFPFDLIFRSARWRSSPASDGQISFLNQFRGDDAKLEPGSITKGKAGDWITKVKHGVVGRFHKAVDEKRKVEVAQEKRAAFQEMQSSRAR